MTNITTATRARFSLMRTKWVVLYAAILKTALTIARAMNIPSSANKINIKRQNEKFHNYTPTPDSALPKGAMVDGGNASLA